MKVRIRCIILLIWLFGIVGKCVCQTDTLAAKLDVILNSRISSKGRNPVNNYQFYFNCNNQVVYNKMAATHDNGINLNYKYKSASVAKTFIATMIMQLHEEGLINIDSSISCYFDSTVVNKCLISGKIDISKNITIRRLLNHTTGMKDYILDDKRFLIKLKTFPRKYYLPSEHLNRYKRHRLNEIQDVDFGKFYYSDTNYLLLAMLIETITKKSIQENLKNRIVDKLSLKNTYVDSWDSAYRNVLHQYIHRQCITKRLNPSFEFGGGGLITTTDDLFIFINGLFQNKLFKKTETLRNMLETQNTEYCLGLMIKRIPEIWIDGKSKDTLIAYGHESYFGTEMYHVPSKNITWIINKNQAYINRHTKQFPVWLIALRLYRKEFM